MTTSRVGSAAFARYITSIDEHPELRGNGGAAHAPIPGDGEPHAAWCRTCAGCCRQEWPCTCCRTARIVTAATTLAGSLLRSHTLGNLDLDAWPDAANLLAALGMTVPMDDQ